MRNLKKVLSLALALVMLLGMMVVGAGAATSFEDDDKIQNKEAAAVLVGMGIMKGRVDGSGNVLFDPEGTLTRAEAAMMIAQMDLGVDAAAALKANGTNPFTDVWSGHWAEGAIDYCVEQDYINGDGAGHFMPNNKVTGVQFAIMLLRLLGYDAKIEGLVGADWATKGAALARKAGLTTNVLANNLAMTRDDMAQMAFNSLTASMVEYEGLDITIGDVTLNARAKVRTHSQDQGGLYSNKTYDGKTPTPTTPIRLCEERFPDLKLTTDEDVFGRIESVWTWKKVNIAGSEQVLAADFEFTEKKSSVSINGAKGGTVPNTTAKVILNGRELTTAAEINDYKPDTAKNGVIDADLVAGLTQNGRLVQVFLRENDHTAIEKVVAIDTFVGQVTAVNSSKGTVTIDTKTQPATATVRTFDATGMNVGDIVAYTAAYASDGKYYVQDTDVITPSVTDVLTKWNGTSVVSGDKGNADSNFTVGGDTYKYSFCGRIDDEDGNPMNNGIAGFTVNKSEINVYLDKYGFALYVSGVESEKLYAAVIGIGSSNTHGSERRGVTLLLPDGTQKEVTATMDNWDLLLGMDYQGTPSYVKSNLKSIGATGHSEEMKNLVTDGVADIVTYTVGDNDIYKLTLAGEKTIEHTSSGSTKVYSGNFDMLTDGTTGKKTEFTTGKSEIKLMSKYDSDPGASGVTDPTGSKSYYTTSKTLFMIATQRTGKGDFGGRDYAVYTGYANAPTLDPTQVKGVAFVTNRLYTSQVDVVYIDAVSTPNTTVSNTYFVKDGSDIITTNEGKYYELPAVVGGELNTIRIDASAMATWPKTDSSGSVDSSRKSLEEADKGLYAINGVRANSKGIIEECSLISFNVSGTGSVRDRYDVLGIGTTLAGAKYYAIEDNASLFYITKKWAVEKVELKDIVTDANDLVFAEWSKPAPNNTKLGVAFVIEVDDGSGTVTPPPANTDKITGVNITTPTAVKVSWKGPGDAPTIPELVTALNNKLVAEKYTDITLDQAGAGVVKMTGTQIVSGFPVKTTFTITLASDLQETRAVTDPASLTAAIGATGVTKIEVTDSITSTDATISKPIEVATGKVLTLNATTTLTADITGAGKVTVGGSGVITNGDKIKVEGGLTLAASSQIDKIGDVDVTVTGATTITGAAEPKSLTQADASSTIAIGASGSLALTSATELKANVTGTSGAAITVTGAALTGGEKIGSNIALTLAAGSSIDKIAAGSSVAVTVTGNTTITNEAAPGSLTHSAGTITIGATTGKLTLPAAFTAIAHDFVVNGELVLGAADTKIAADATVTVNGKVTTDAAKILSGNAAGAKVVFGEDGTLDNTGFTGGAQNFYDGSNNKITDVANLSGSFTWNLDADGSGAAGWAPTPATP